VSFGVRDRGSGGNVPDGARGRAADVDGLGAAAILAVVFLGIFLVLVVIGLIAGI